MAEQIVSLILGLAGVYFSIGLVFGIAFVLKGVQQIDPSAVGGSKGFRLFILPGTMVFWPLLARRWKQGSAPPEEYSPHRCAACGKCEKEAV